MDFLSFVPQLFYDLIARVLPGSLILFLFGWNFPFWIPDFLELKDFEGWSPFLGFLILAYFLSLILKPMGGKVLSRIRRKRRSVRLIQKRKEAYDQFNLLRAHLGSAKVEIPDFLTPDKTTAPEETPPSTNLVQSLAIHTVHDHLRYLFPREGSRILKLHAEYNMLIKIGGGMILLLVFNLVAPLFLGISVLTHIYHWPIIHLVLMILAFQQADQKQEISYFSTTLSWLEVTHPIAGIPAPTS